MVAACPSKGTATITRSAAPATSTFDPPRTDTCTPSAAAPRPRSATPAAMPSARSASREPSRIFCPAAASRTASPRPCGPVPPKTPTVSALTSGSSRAADGAGAVVTGRSSGVSAVVVGGRALLEEGCHGLLLVRRGTGEHLLAVLQLHRGVEGRDLQGQPHPLLGQRQRERRHRQQVVDRALDPRAELPGGG